MKFHKTKLLDLPCCYSVAALEAEGRLRYLFATDDTGPCYSVDALTLEREEVWRDPGGTMSMVPIPGADGAFLAVQRFLPGFRAREARIVRVQRDRGQWRVAPWMDLPYVHRFDILEREGRRYLLACILSGTDQPQADFENPGFLAAAELDENCSPPGALAVIATGMTRNHGYWRQVEQGQQVAYTACDQGVFRVEPPCSGGGWRVERILDAPCSDVALCDIDGDGGLELATIQPFHGAAFVVYKQVDGAYREWYRCPEAMDFLHVVWGGRLLGEPVFLGGCRGLDKELFVLRWKDGSIVRQVIESGYGPSNVLVLPGKDGDKLLVANREGAEAALLDVTQEEALP